MDFFGSTRPVLNRMLSDQSYEEPESSKDALGSPLGATYQKEAERTVIVHEVAPTDSLPGVALKYGIALSELRRANQLWPSDPIHLRKTLYIPVDKTSRRDLVEALVSPGPSSPPPINSPTDSPFNRISPHGHPQSPGSPNLPATATIRRIPASRLSFFPPSQSSALNRSKTLPRKFSTPPLSASAPVIPAGRRSPTRSTKASALTSIFNALPINVPRISLDSTRSNTSASDDQEHEMADVSWSVPKTASPFDAFPSFESPRRTGYTPASKPARTTHMRQASKGGLIELDQDPTPGRGPAPVRTAQMEPSPAMTLPLGSRTDMADTKVASRRRIPESFRTRPPDSGIS
ncbi:hypothetical protein PUNSTDRAFT_50497 [Punctularia strigosozonata HHB-11173 SS5]|uniref:uncharacterized protein n=1 Tax=Punctularia strigosozonata (strain HHB-11173) TaxID=741275 RepID=UPI0004416330|nr:uncharacterized protein PUNSTDRAFT_50497 [Punctularia strigosozonata HHB-11173 SS5]EIN11539.1 hypothetical protein PUNSTDRAFT_50497 [Punctularia strigosozonata HHB-11173 SS5]